MATILNIESFSNTNLRERTTLTAGAEAGASALVVASIAGYAVGDILYVGELSREGCEKVIIQSISGLVVTLTSALKHDHAAYTPVVSVLGDLIHVYRAANVDGTVPADVAFTVLATRDIDPDQLSTYYTDSSGSSSYWYRFTYYNATTLDETDLADSIAVRGDDFGHYASLSEIRAEAGFSNNYNLKDTFIDQQRRAAEAEINTALASAYTVPFTTVPEIIRTLTIQLAAGLLLQDQYGSGSTKGSAKLKAARDQLKAMQNREQTITGEGGVSIATGGISYYPSNDQNLWIPGGRAFPEDDRRSHRILIKTSVGALAGRHARAHGSTRRPGPERVRRRGRFGALVARRDRPRRRPADARRSVAGRSRRLHLPARR
ncbi:MAG: phage protein Gp36 family protein [Rhodococcus sp. (in: high G+C Gram-positive bacteria)]